MADSKIKVTVVYTHNVSRAIRVHELPRPGETVRSIGYSEGIDGAKGTDVAVALGRLGVPTALIANVRRGDWIEQGHVILSEAGVDDRFITEYDDPSYSRGAMFIDDNGNNMIVLSSGRQQFPRELMESALDAYPDAEYCVTGHELGEEGVRDAVLSASSRGLKVIINPSPVPDSIPDYWDKAYIIVLNEHELIRLLGDDSSAVSGEKVRDSLARFTALSGCSAVVLTLGEKGYMLYDGSGFASGEGTVVENVIDTSGAGDGFLAAMTAALAKGMSLADACAWANRYSSIGIQREGTITCYPTLEEAEAVAGPLGGR